MFKPLLSLLLLCSVIISNAQNYDASKIDGYLQNWLSSNSGEKLPVFILLADRVDVENLDRQFYEKGTSQTGRIRTLIPLLKNKAARTQAAPLQWMQHHPGIDQQTITSFWVTNVMLADADATAISSLSRRSDVEWIGFQGSIEPEKYECTSAPPFLSPDGREPGLAAIKATTMWKMGYTGYGRKAMIIDSGVDFSHPQLHMQFWGNNVGIGEAWLDAENRSPQDCDDHGTHVCGITMGLNRLENDTTGVAFNANWMASPIFSNDCGGGFSYVIASFQWAIDPDGDMNTTADMPDVINNSWRWSEPGNNECNGVFKSTFDAVEAAGIAIVFSAGNEGDEVSTITSPKNINTTLVNTFATASVNANTPALAIANSSSRGPSLCGGDSSFLIKPEVAAPGVSVRSSVPGNGYSFFSGTSMAAPHVSGAVLLLKEAFPNLTGTEVKLALYFTARDLGEPGEDNVFGMGIIDVPAAFQYLIDQGHSPQLTARVNDIMLIDLQINEERICAAKGIVPIITFENGGTDTIFSFNISYILKDANMVSGSIEWTGVLAPGQRGTYELPLATLPAGNYDIVARLDDPNGVMDDRNLNNQLFAPLEVFETEPVIALQLGSSDEVCQSNSAILSTTYNGSGTVQWFTDMTIKDPIAIGSHFLTPPLDTTTTYFVDVLESFNVGKEAWTANGGDYSNETKAGLIFDSHTPFVLKSVKVYVKEPGSRFISLNQLDGGLFGERIVSLPDTGEQRITLNFKVPEGEDFLLSLSFGKPLGVSLSGVSFPYEVADVASLKRTEGNVPFTNRYYYFYDWEIEYSNPCGRTAITVDVAENVAPPDAAFAIATDSLAWIQAEEIQFEDASIGAENWYWDFGDGNFSLLQNPVHFYADSGQYTVSLVVENADGCSDAFYKTIQIAPMPVGVGDLNGVSNSVNLYPNPARSQVFVSFELDSREAVQLQLFDLLGRKVFSSDTRNVDNYKWSVPTSHLQAGVYYMSINIGDRRVLKKLLVN